MNESECSFSICADRIASVCVVIKTSTADAGPSVGGWRLTSMALYRVLHSAFTSTAYRTSVTRKPNVLGTTCLLGTFAWVARPCVTFRVLKMARFLLTTY